MSIANKVFALDEEGEDGVVDDLCLGIKYLFNTLTIDKI
jgi:hypothetical protein